MKKLVALIRYIDRELFLILFVLLALAVFIPIFTYAYYASDLKDKNTILNKNDTGIILLDNKNQPFFTFYQAKVKNYIPLSQIPLALRQAVIASEDKDFYSHSGFSFKSIIRALWMNFSSKNQIYGGSTLTQQLVKNVLLNSNRNFSRKLQEIILAQEIERKFSKDEILEMYLNAVYFGEGVFGVENASEFFFSKKPKDLTLNEAAFLISILPSPSSLSPFSGNADKVTLHKNIILKKMLEQKYITESQMNTAMKAPLVFHRNVPDINQIAPHFAIMVRDDLIKKYGEEFIYRSGLKVKTTLNRDWQTTAENVLATQIDKLRANGATNGAVVIIDPKTGEIKAMVGSVDWYNDKYGKVNLATTPRSVGSSFKPIVYAAAFENNLITTSTILHDSPTTFPGGYRPLNYDRKFRGNVTVRRALANSLNVPAVEVMQKVGVPNALAMAKKLGITSLKDPANYGLSLVLGTGEVSLLEMTDVYATLANDGIKNDPTAILEIYNKQGKKIYSYTPKPEKVLNSQVASSLTSILADNNARAEEFGNLLTTTRRAAVKTGTAEDYRDSLTLGYNPGITIGVWVGNNDNTPMDGVAGSLGAAPIWKTLIDKFADSRYDAEYNNLVPTPVIVKIPTSVPTTVVIQQPQIAQPPQVILPPQTLQLNLKELRQKIREETKSHFKHKSD